MKRKDVKKFFIRKNKRGYWEKGGGCETELLVATIALGLVCTLIVVGIVTELFWR